jgi:solute carrier family 9B (sodium/hydrogen exchanger), member 1/2
MKPWQLVLGLIEFVVLFIVAHVLGKVVSLVPSCLQSLYNSLNSLFSKPNEIAVQPRGRDDPDAYWCESAAENVECHKPWPVLPAFLGMLIAGIVAANLPGALIANIPVTLSLFTRKLALTVILARAGLNLDINALKSYGASTLRLASIPCLCEAGIAAASARFVTSMDWAFCLCLGFMLAAVSPAVVVPSLLALQEQGYGVSKGIPTMILAAASLDDVLAICGLGMAMDVAFARLEGDGDGSRAALWTALVVPITVVGGVVVGVLLGALQYGIALLRPSDSMESLVHSDTSKAAVLLVLCVAVVYGAATVEYDAAGYLAVMIMGRLCCVFFSLVHMTTCSYYIWIFDAVLWHAGFVAARGWDRLDTHDTAGVSENFKQMWSVLMPALFMLIGAQVDLSVISLGVVGEALVVLAVAVVGRVLITYSIMTLEPGLQLYERMFIALAWLPKATVQAALGSVVLDRSLSLTLSDDAEELEAERAGKFILTAAVLAILITAPIGAIGIYVAGPRWLDNRAVTKDAALEPNSVPVCPPQLVPMSSEISRLGQDGRNVLFIELV